MLPIVKESKNIYMGRGVYSVCVYLFDYITKGNTRRINQTPIKMVTYSR